MFSRGPVSHSADTDMKDEPSGYLSSENRIFFSENTGFPLLHPKRLYDQMEIACADYLKDY
jgi:hypothetical protein